MRKRPMVFITLSYITGIILGRLFYVSLWILFIVLGLFLLTFICAGLFKKDFAASHSTWISEKFKKVFFYIGLCFVGYMMCSIFINDTYSCGNFDSNNGVFNFLYLDKARQHIRNIMYFNVPNGPERCMLDGLFLGERYKIPSGLINAFRRTNTMHILAISGLHVGFIGLIFIGLFRLVYIPKKSAALLAVLGIVFYVFIVGWKPPAFRAAVMFGVLFLGMVLDRPVDTVNSLFFAALVILLVSPTALFQAGFQLSFIIVFFLLIALPIIEERKNVFIRVLAVSTTAWLGSFPLTAYYFGIISPISVLANIIIVPAVGLIIALGFSSIIAGTLFLPVSGIFNMVNYYLIKAIISIIKYLSRVPGAFFYIKWFPWQMVIISYAFVYLLIFFLLQKRQSVIK